MFRFLSHRIRRNSSLASVDILSIALISVNTNPELNVLRGVEVPLINVYAVNAASENPPSLIAGINVVDEYGDTT